MSDKLRIEFNEQEKKDSYGVAVEFVVHEGNLTIHEDWGHMDELWGDGCRVFISPRIWAEAAPWIATHFTK